MSFTYCMARAESMLGGGALSGGKLMATLGCNAVGGCTSMVCLSRSQASKASADDSRTSQRDFETVILKSLSLRLFRLPRGPLLGMDQPCDSDAHRVKSDHRRGEDAHIQDVRCRRYDGRNDEDNQDGIAEILPHESRADDSHQR